MSEFNQMSVSGSDLNEFSRSLTKAIQSLPPEQRKQLDAIRMNCFAAYGFEGTRDRLNKKTVGEILEEFDNVTFPFRTIVEGERDGVRYRLTEPTPDGETKENSG
jgi:hypothetical protein